MTNIPSIIDGETPMPTGSDPIELRAAEIARRHHRTQVTDRDREHAYEELRGTAPRLPSDELASH